MTTASASRRPSASVGRGVCRRGSAARDVRDGRRINVAARPRARRPTTVRSCSASATHRLVAPHVQRRAAGAARGARPRRDGSACRLLGAAAPESRCRSRRRSTPFIGREPELAALRELLARADRERACRLVTVVGPPGSASRGSRASSIDDVSRTRPASSSAAASPTATGSRTGRWPRSSVSSRVVIPERGIAELLARRRGRRARSTARARRDRARRRAGAGRTRRSGRSGGCSRRRRAAAARRGARRRALGRADAARPARVPRGVLERIADPARLPRAPGAAREPARRGRRRNRPFLLGSRRCPTRDARRLRRDAGRRANSSRRRRRGSSRRRTATRSSSSSSSPCAPSRTSPPCRPASRPCSRRASTRLEPDERAVLVHASVEGRTSTAARSPR